ncbi:MAG: flagellar basal body rod protein FlgB [bacterium]
MEPTINLLSTGLDGSWKRQEALANNVSNINTPNYKRQDVNFKDILKKQMQTTKKLTINTTKKKHIPLSNSNDPNFKISQNRSIKYRNDSNNVDVDVEMAEVAKNNIYYSTLINQVSARFNMIGNVIRKGSAN